MPWTSSVQISCQNGLCVCACCLCVGCNLLKKQKLLYHPKSCLNCTTSSWNMSSLQPQTAWALLPTPAPHRAVSQQAAQALQGRALSARPVAGTAQASKRALQARQGPLQEKLCSFPPLSSVLHKWNSSFTPQLLSQYISYCALGAGSESHPFKFRQIQSED